MLFAVDANGVPSIAKTVKINESLDSTDPYSENLVLDLNFDEGNGRTAYDNSGYGNNATILEKDANANNIDSGHNFFTSDGYNGGAIELNGDKVQPHAILSMDVTESLSSTADKITVMAWVNRNENAQNVAIFVQRYPQLFFGFHDSRFKWEFPTSTGDRASCYAGYSPVGEWLHVAATYDGQVAILYVNGEEVCKKNVTGKINYNNDGTEWTTFTAGGHFSKRDGTDIVDELAGRLDDLKVYNISLNAADIKNIYEGTIPTPEDNFYCEQPEVANSNSGSGKFQDELYFFNWNSSTFSDGLQDGDQQVFNLANGIQVTATFSNVVNGGSIDMRDMNSWSGSLIHNLYNTSGSNEAIHGKRSPSSFSVSFKAVKDGNPYSLDIIATDAEATARSEKVKFSTNGTYWRLLENFGNGGEWSGKGTNDLTSVFTAENGNAIYYSSDANSINVSLENTRGNQAVAFGMRLKCDSKTDANCDKNLALGKETSQSSTEHGGQSSRAVDGNTNGNYWRSSVTHTTSETNPYWEVDLEKEEDISDIVVWNRTDCCTTRLNDFVIKVFDKDRNTVYTHKNQGSANSNLVSINSRGRYVRISLEGTDRFLSLAEVQVFGCGDNSNVGKSGNLAGKTNQLENTSSKAYPNPTSGPIQLELSKYIGQSLSISVLNGFNQEVLHQNLNSNHENTISLDFTNFSSGVYTIIIVNNKNNREIIRVIVN